MLVDYVTKFGAFEFVCTEEREMEVPRMLVKERRSFSNQ